MLLKRIVLLLLFVSFISPFISKWILSEIFPYTGLVGMPVFMIVFIIHFFSFIGMVIILQKIKNNYFKMVLILMYIAISTYLVWLSHPYSP